MATAVLAGEHESGSFFPRAWVLRIWSSWRCNCVIGSRMAAVLMQFAFGRSSAAQRVTHGCRKLTLSLREQHCENFCEILVSFNSGGTKAEENRGGAAVAEFEKILCPTASSGTAERSVGSSGRGCRRELKLRRELVPLLPTSGHSPETRHLRPTEWRWQHSRIRCWRSSQ